MNDVSPDEEGNVAIAIDITKSVSTFNGNIILGFDHTVGLGETEILLTNLELIEKGGSAPTSKYVHEGILNDGEITVNEYNQGANKDTYKAELTDEGYKLSFTGATTENEWQIWDAFVAKYDTTKEYEKLILKYKVLKSDTTLQKVVVELSGEGDNIWTMNDVYPDEEGNVTQVIDITKSVSTFSGFIILGFDHTVGLGETEILVTELSIK